jgi:RNA polymerase sigma factor (TIGR02999 family)
MGEITTLIRAASQGEREAVDRLFGLLYDDLHRLAHARLRGNARDTLLDTTALLHETYARLVRTGELEVEDRRHFFAYCAGAMRSIIVDFARRRSAARRGGADDRVTLDDGLAGAPVERSDEVLRVHQGLERLAQVDERLARLVEMRYFAGLENREIAEAFGVSERTVERQWQKARAFLFASLT